MNHGSSGLLLLVIYFLLSIFLMPLFQGPGSEQDLINRAAAASLVERTTFDISHFEKERGEKFADVKRVGDRVYPDRPPGFTIVSAPLYALTRVVLGEADDANLRAGWFVLRFLLASCPVLLLGIWLFSSEVDAFSLGVFLFATPLFPLSLIYSPLVFVAVLVYLAFRVIFDFDRVMPGRCFTAGLFLGFCLLCDLRALLPVFVFFVGLLFTGGREVRNRISYYLAGMLPFAGALTFYSWWVFGDVLAVVPMDSLRLPVLYTFFEMWFSPSKGLFFYAPVLLFSIFAVFTTKAGGTLRFGVKYSLIVLALVLSVFWRDPDAVFAVPASTFAIVLPMFLDPLFDGESDDYSSLWRGFFFTLSLLFCAIPLLSYPFAPAVLDYPHNSFWQPLIFERLSFAPNSVEWFGFSSPWLIAVPATALLLVLFAVLRTARYPARFAIGILAGLLLVGNYMFLPDLETEKAKPYIEERISRTA
ncbi:MAG: hypothetical protein IPM63_08950 [Acidobacteriota bacterium]|nr:MAG: hypothetical protein IPM63_08950 [Acidobacteriota bacterium]